jgi:hypothetical protein
MTEDELDSHKDDRAEYYVKLRIGTILRDEDGNEQIFIGWRQNTCGHEMVFSQIYRKWGKVRPWGMGEPQHYHASMLGTLCRKFPGLRKYVSG